MTGLYYNVVKRKWTADVQPFAVYVSTSDTSLNECNNYETLDEFLGAHTSMCMWEKEVVNVKLIDEVFQKLGLSRSYTLMRGNEISVI